MTIDPPAPASLQRDGEDPVPVRANCSLGRSSANDLVLVSDRVSRRHATIHVQEEREFWLVDLGSRNGTYLNGRRIGQPTRLRDRDEIQIGPFTLRFVVGAEDGACAPADIESQTLMDVRTANCWLLLCDIVGSSTMAREGAPDEIPLLVGAWFAATRDAVEQHGGSINKYLGDGLLAYWHDDGRSADGAVCARVVETLRALRRMQDERRPVFRVVIHHGRIILGGLPSSGEESLAGPEVNFVFRQEKLAGELKAERLASEAAVRRLGDGIGPAPAGSHRLAGFDGEYAFFSFEASGGPPDTGIIP